MLYEIVKSDGTHEKVSAQWSAVTEGIYSFYADNGLVCSYAPGTWLEVWRREGVGE